mmetsp:Transcript_18196/g.42335  ORF Transcript_18196/g.42335 Transcript_18196/m.42335 type:complete len:203 (-) Transcript_18196:556-1164(-)
MWRPSPLFFNSWTSWPFSARSRPACKTHRPCYHTCTSRPHWEHTRGPHGEHSLAHHARATHGSTTTTHASHHAFAHHRTHAAHHHACHSAHAVAACRPHTATHTSRRAPTASSAATSAAAHPGAGTTSTGSRVWEDSDVPGLRLSIRSSIQLERYTMTCKIGSAECRLYAVSGEPDVLVDLIADDEAKAFYSTEALHGALQL